MRLFSPQGRPQSPESHWRKPRRREDAKHQPEDLPRQPEAALTGVCEKSKPTAACGKPRKMNNKE
jgi:hypothetical protein